MRFAMSKGWLRPSVQKAIWQLAFEMPTAKAIKGVTIEDDPSQCFRKSLTAKDGVSIRAARGRQLINGCARCWRAVDYGVHDYCGMCRFGPTIMERDWTYMGGDADPVMDYTDSPSPRAVYLRKRLRMLYQD